MSQEEKLRKRCLSINDKRLAKLLELHSIHMRCGNLQLQQEPMQLQLAECDVQIAHLKEQVCPCPPLAATQTLFTQSCAAHSQNHAWNLSAQSTLGAQRRLQGRETARALLFL